MVPLLAATYYVLSSVSHLMLSTDIASSYILVSLVSIQMSVIIFLSPQTNHHQKESCLPTLQNGVSRYNNHFVSLESNDAIRCWTDVQ